MGPDSLSSGRFDILAKLPAGATADQVPEMLQTLLLDRFKMTVHRETRELPVYALIAGKGGTKLAARPPDYDPKVKSDVRPMTLDAYAQAISATLDRPVVDKTELPGEYMLSTQFVLRDVMAAARARMDHSDTAPDPRVSSAFSEVQALGLKLDPRKLPLPVVVIDHAEKLPSEN